MEQMTEMPLSESTNGEAIHITATSSNPGNNLVHTAPAQGYDLIWIYAGNKSAGTIVTTIEWTTAGITGAVAFSVLSNPAWQMTIPLVGGLLLRNSATIEAFAATTAVINLFGHVERYS